jgi:magnesium-transporting ATPase (P-type)
MLLAALSMTIAFVLVRRQSWYVRSTDLVGPENTTLFYLSTFHTYALAFSYSISKPFKKPLYTNRLFCAVLAILFVIQLYVIIVPDVKFTSYWLELDGTLTMKWRIILLAMCFVHWIVSYLFERVVIAGPGKKFVTSMFKRKFIQTKYLLLVNRREEVKWSHSNKKYNQIKLRMMTNIENV